MKFSTFTLFLEKSKINHDAEKPTDGRISLTKRETSHDPVIFLTFKNVKFDSWEHTLDKRKELLQTEFGRYRLLIDSDTLAEYEKEYFSKFVLLFNRSNT